MIPIRSLTLLFFCASSLAHAQTLGIYTAGDDVVVFDADTDTIRGTLVGVGHLGCSDVVITPDQRLAFAVFGGLEIWVIDLTSDSPRFAPGVNPIPVSAARDLSLSSDGRFLISAGEGLEDIAIVSIAERAQIAGVRAPVSISTVEAFPFGSFVVGNFTNRFNRLTLDENGVPNETSDSFLEHVPCGAIAYNVLAAPGGRTALALRFEHGCDNISQNQYISLRMPGMEVLDRHTPISRNKPHAAMSPRGDRVFSRIGTFVEALSYDALTGEFGELTFSVRTENPSGQACAGGDILAVHPNGKKLYVPDRGNFSTNAPALIRIYDTHKGEQVGAIPVAPHPDPNRLRNPKAVYVTPATTVSFEAPIQSLTKFENGMVASGDIGVGVTIKGRSQSGNSAALFDSSPDGPNAGGAAPDLLVDLGRILVLQADATQSVPGVFDVPSDDPAGGVLRMHFQGDLVTPIAIDLIALTPDSDRGATVILHGQGKRTRTYVVPAGWTEVVTVQGASFGTLELTTLAPQPGFRASARAFEDPGFDSDAVLAISVHLEGSGAVDNVAFRRNRPRRVLPR